MQHIRERVVTTIDAVGSRLGINSRYFTYHSSVVLTAHAINVVYGIIVSYLSTLLFSQNLYGQYRFVLSVLGFLGAIKLSGMPSAIARDVNQHESSPLRYTLRLYSSIMLLLGVALLAAIPCLLYWDRLELWPMFAVATVLAPVEAVAMTFAGGMITGKALFKTALQYSLIAKASMLLLSLGVFLFYPTPTLLLAVTLGINITVYGTLVYRLLPRYTNDEKTNRILNYGFKLSLANIPTTLVWYVDNLIIAASFGMSQLATFAVALLAPEQIKQIFKELLNVTFAKLAQGKDTAERKQKIIKMALLGTVPFALLIAAYWLAAPWIFEYIFPKYFDSHTILLSRFAAITLIVMPWNLIPQYLEAQGFVEETKRANLLAAAIFLICLLTLIPTYRLIGAVISRAVFRFMYVALSWWYLTHPVKHAR